MKIQAVTVADSISPQGHRLWSGLLTFPKYLLAEAKTHRIVSQDSNEVEIMLDVSLNAAKELSRNSASSRAIPTNRLLKMVGENPFIPMAWQKEHKGMQGTEYETNNMIIKGNIATWLNARDAALEAAGRLTVGSHVTKQLANRLLEPFLWTTVLVTATEWENFFELRCPQYTHKSKVYRSRKDVLAALEAEANPNYQIHLNANTIDWLKSNTGQAEIHMMALAEAIWDAQNESKPKQLKAGEWHILFQDKMTHEQFGACGLDYELPRNRIKVSTAMAARTSYTVVGDEKEVSYETLLGIHDKIVAAKPFHASPCEHCARAMSDEEYARNVKGVGFIRQERDMGLLNEITIMPEETYGWCRNFRGFIQYRHLIESNERNREI